MQQGLRFLDSAALAWRKQRKCFACHSNYVFLMARPAVTHKVPAHKQIREAAEYLATHPHKMGYQATEAVMVASVLAQNDAATTGKLHSATRFALDRIWDFQREDGGWTWLDDNESPSAQPQTTMHRRRLLKRVSIKSEAISVIIHQRTLTIER